MSIEQKAREIADRWIDSGDDGDEAYLVSLGIIEGLEMALKAVKDVEAEYPHGNMKFGGTVRNECLTAIRALIEEQKV